MVNPSVATLTQSKFYSPAFNAAIFDGPLRIYFAQYQESLALEIYFKIQQVLKNFTESRKQLKNIGANIFVMLYPSSDVFNLSFEVSGPDANCVAVSRIDKDYVFGINSTINDSGYDFIFSHLQTVFSRGQC
ncbi:MAG: hypothetical protein A4S09_02740 [Proteobacteria bacterium SG_bin7]|nr:MAG: hypothetical protein A4S09_02740 [Proteobacteria bacterium SG_bin7]